MEWLCIRDDSLLGHRRKEEVRIWNFHYCLFFGFGPYCDPLTPPLLRSSSTPTTKKHLCLFQVALLLIFFLSKRSSKWRRQRISEYVWWDGPNTLSSSIRESRAPLVVKPCGGAGKRESGLGQAGGDVQGRKKKKISSERRPQAQSGAVFLYARFRGTEPPPIKELSYIHNTHGET